MKTNGFHTSTRGKRVMAASLVIALVLAAISIVNAFAAPSPNSVVKINSTVTRALQSHLHELAADQAWYNNAKDGATNLAAPTNAVEVQQYLNQYAFALAQAEAVFGSNRTVTNLSGWLHEMHSLQVKLASLGLSTSSNIAGAAVAGNTPGSPTSTSTPNAG